MAARRGFVEDLFEIGSRLSWRTSLVVAAIAALGLHVLAVTSTAPAPVTGTAALGGFAARNLIGVVASFMQFVVPLALLVGALGSYFSRSHARTLLGAATTGASQAVAKMSWAEFERLIGEAFRRRGFEVKEIGGRTADGGVDLVLSKDGKQYLVQCKHWRVQRVGVGVVRELNGVVAARRAAGGYVVTSGTFTQDARGFAQSCAIELIDGQALASLIREIAAKQMEGGVCSSAASAPAAASRKPAGTACPKCGSAMVRRVAKQGTHARQSFWGCSRYPECRGTRSMASR